MREIIDANRHQFLRTALLPPTTLVSVFRLNNYIDGRNGVYRLHYSSHRGDGYGPFELTQTLLDGWWVFLQSSEMEKVFENLLRNYPWTGSSEIAVLGPAYRRIQGAPEQLDRYRYRRQATLEAALSFQRFNATPRARETRLAGGSARRAQLP